MKKINILIDGNFIAFSSFAVFANYGKNKDPLKGDRRQATFIQDLTGRLFHILNMLPKGGQVVFCLDSKSWRKEFSEKYKESREDEVGNKGIMDNESKQIFYSLLAEFGDVLKTAGIHVSRVPSAEGDDLLFKWAEHFNGLGENCIIISGDGDMKQLVKGPEAPWTIVWSNKSTNNKIFTMPGWTDTIEESSGNTIFEFNIVDDQNLLSKMIRDSGASVKHIDIAHYVLHKILIGDDGDDVPSCWKVSKGVNADGQEKFIRVTDKKAERILELAIDGGPSYSGWLDIMLSKIEAKGKDRSFSDVDEQLDEFSGILLRVMGDLDDKELRKNVTENLLRNARLVWLRSEMLPPDVNQTINEDIEKSVQDIQGINRAKWNKNALLEGSRFGKERIAPMGFDPFSLVELPSED